MDIYRVLMNMESDNMGLVTYNCDPEYSEEEINSRQLAITEMKRQPYYLVSRMETATDGVM